MAERSLLRISELTAGQQFRSGARTITETDLAMSSMLSGDWSPIHADAAFASATPAGRTVLHGSYGVMLALGLAANILKFKEPVLALLGLDEWRFKSPLVPGDTVHLRIEIVSVRVTSSKDKAVLTSRLSLVREDLTTVQEGLHALMLGLS
jgi:acyl dehydratase